MKKILVTGGCGFIGSNFIRHMLSHGKVEKIINLDLLTYAGNLENLADVEADPRYEFVRGDVCNFDLAAELMGRVDAAVNFAAESHVDRSIIDSSRFVRTNVAGVQTLLDAAREAGLERFVQISTDEVYGSLGPEGRFTERTPLAPNSPYSASKASADMLVRAYHHTHGLPAVITRCSNNYGPYQFPEKIVPLFITNLLADKPVPIYGDGANVRDWIFVGDHCCAIDAVLRDGRPGEIYNIGGGNERSNIEITRLLLAELGKDESMIEHIADRPGHDLRYAVDCSKIQSELGWRPAHGFTEGLRLTINWYRDNAHWWRRIKTGEYMKYYEQQYGKRRQ
ncbi:MAG: dTDP-glucose 4,6-dehydratase [Planctomycetes bacterium]|nr:dTDP-glucose 4,6-dehydratase [Planctomycetota bacterium]